MEVYSFVRVVVRSIALVFSNHPSLIVASSAPGNYKVVSMLLRKAADPYVSVNTCSFSPGLRGFGNAYAAAAAHGLKNILRKLLAEPGPRRENDMLSLTEILTEG